MSVKPIKVDEDLFRKEYKNLLKLCVEEGDVLPGLLQVIEVSDDLAFTEQEISNVKISEEASSSRHERIMELESKLADITYDGDLSKLNDDLNTVYNEELMGFIGRHPEYQKLLK